MGQVAWSDGVWVFSFAQALAGEFDPVGVVDEAIEDGVGDGGIADDFVPAIDGHLAGDDERSRRRSDPRRSRAGRGAARQSSGLGSPVVEDEQVDAGELTRSILV